MKRKLRLEELSIDAFTTSSAEDGRGTVYGEEATNRPTCAGPTCYETCDGIHSCDYSAECPSVAAGTC